MRISDWSSDVCSSDLSAMSIFTQKAFYRAGFVAGAMLLMPSILLAQDTGSEAQSQPPLSADDETPIMYREIVVTARRRDERLQDVPVSVNAFSAEALARSTIDRKSTRLNTSH